MKAVPAPQASECLATARDLRARGLSVIPIPRPRPGVVPGNPGDGKVPALAWREFQDRLPTDQDLARWFSRVPMNLAVVTGAISGVVVVDADSQDALRWCVRHLPRTPWQTATSRGFHLWYRYPGVRVPNRARIETRDGRLALDVRGDGGFVVGPTSLHATGAVYQFAGDWTVPPDDVPRFWPDWLQRPECPTASKNAPRPSGEVIERARNYLAAIPRPEIGMGSDAGTLYAACRLVRGFGLSDGDAETLLWEWAGGRAGWTREWVAEKVTHAAKYGTEPVGALR